MNYFKALLETGAVRIDPSRPFTWASGVQSPIYCDNRLLISEVELRKEIAKELAKRAATHSPDLIAGTATAGIPWASFVAYEMNLPMVYVRSQSKGHGQGRQIEGRYKAGQKVVLIEDLISTGGSSIRAAEALESENLKVAEICALFSYETKKAQEAFAKTSYNAWTMATVGQLLETMEFPDRDSEAVLSFLTSI